MTRNGQRLLLLIDDEPAQRRLVSALAARTGWRSVFANDGEMAIATLGTQDGMQLDAILLDHWGREADAAALIAELEAESGAEVLPLSGATGQGLEAVLDRLIEAIGPSEMHAQDTGDDEERREWSPI